MNTACDLVKEEGKDDSCNYDFVLFCFFDMFIFDSPFLLLNFNCLFAKVPANFGDYKANDK